MLLESAYVPGSRDLVKERIRQLIEHIRPR